MRGLPRILMMFAPMIFRAVSKYYKQWQAKKSAEEFVQEPYDEGLDKTQRDKGTLNNEDLV